MLPVVVFDETTRLVFSHTWVNTLTLSEVSSSRLKAQSNTHLKTSTHSVIDSKPRDVYIISVFVTVGFYPFICAFLSSNKGLGRWAERPLRSARDHDRVSEAGQGVEYAK